jgi:ParB family chromosome partitioning protein
MSKNREELMSKKRSELVDIANDLFVEGINSKTNKTTIVQLILDKQSEMEQSENEFGTMEFGEMEEKNPTLGFLDIEDQAPEDQAPEQDICVEDTFINNRVVQIPIDILQESPFNFFRPLGESKFKEMVESIKTNGVIEPIIVRPKDDGVYEILSGHNRVRACKELDMLEISARIIKVDDDTAKEIIVETNIVQRDEFSPMELARAYEEKAKSFERRQGQRTDLIGGEKGTTRDLIGKAFEVSGVKVERYMKLNNLIPEFQDMVDNKEIKVKAGTELGFLNEETQRNLLAEVDNDMSMLNNKIIKKIKQKTKEKEKEEGNASLTMNEIRKILHEKPIVKQKISFSITIDEDYDPEARAFLEDTLLKEPALLLEFIKDYVHGHLVERTVENG